MGGTASKANKITPLSAEGNSKLFQQQIAQLQQQLESSKQQNAQLQQQLESDRQQNAQLQQQLESSKHQIAQLQEQLESSKQQNAASLLQSDPQSETQQLSLLHSELESSKQQIAQLQQQLESDKQQNGQLQQRLKNDQLSTAQFDRDISHAAQRKDDAFMREIFNRHAKKDKLSATALIAALKDVSAPVLAAASSEGTLNTADYVFRRADANLSGDVDFSE